MLVLSASASRASQASGERDPLLAQFAGAIAHTYRLKRSDVHADVLLACGSSTEGRAHEAAACAQRIEDQLSLNAWPLQLVVLVGDHTARMARSAGLVTSPGFLIGGQRVPTVVVTDFASIGVGPEWSVLGAPRTQSPVVLYPSAAAVLWSIVDGHCAGHAWRPNMGQWARKDRPPTREDVAAHVSGFGWLSPFKPTGPWPYCVLDVDTHNAIQFAAFEKTASKLTRLFAKSLCFRSSGNGGLHFYLRLPPGTGYADAAIWLAEFLLLQGLLFRKIAPARFATAAGPVVTRIVEVPLHPPRLPFGIGSGLRRTPDPAKAVAKFQKWLESTDCSDFEKARATVMQKRPRTKRWAGRAAWAKTYVHDLELEALGFKDKAKKLPAGDPWTPYLSRFAPSLRVLVTHGCLAFGTRTTTMMRIADVLAEIVAPAEARLLLRHWVEHRDHHSEDIHDDVDDVLAFGDRLIDDAFANRGVPLQAWTHADAAITKMYKNIPTGRAAALGLTEVECRRAAFYILRLFFSARLGCIPIAAEQFGLALKNDNFGALPIQRPNRDRVDAVSSAMQRLGIIKLVRSPRYTEGRAGEYELCAPYWPPPPRGSPELHQMT